MKITDYLLGYSPSIWATFVARVFSVITISLSLFLIFEHLSSYKNLEIKSLLGTKVEWLYYIFQSFNSGNLVHYEELCRVHNAALSAQPALVENEKKLLEKN
ncbi:hypothetical protein J1N35_042310 [Gossypium stocksii]|uniref:Uncharacterized protein n=1 Tax=Gossypium stocksii TaxID=47602 RepID=A0A9D3UHB0_9ROSI|nr:hypothetical protein J1N35_042310 [Gossypium stocksii]